jgi:hypothetical protein
MTVASADPVLRANAIILPPREYVRVAVFGPKGFRPPG